MKSGFSLVELLVAMAIGSVSCLALMQMGTVQMQVQRRIKDKLELIELRALIHQRVDCPATIHYVCEEGDTRIMSTTAPLTRNYSAGKQQLFVAASCSNGSVYAHYGYALGDQVVVPPRPMFPGPLCVPKGTLRHQCGHDEESTGYDFDTKRYVCSPAPPF